MSDVKRVLVGKDDVFEYLVCCWKEGEKVIKFTLEPKPKHPSIVELVVEKEKDDSYGDYIEHFVFFNKSIREVYYVRAWFRFKTDRFLVDMWKYSDITHLVWLMPYKIDVYTSISGKMSDIAGEKPWSRK